jgi:hypothetical protein
MEGNIPVSNVTLLTSNVALLASNLALLASDGVYLDVFAPSFGVLSETLQKNSREPIHQQMCPNLSTFFAYS